MKPTVQTPESGLRSFFKKPWVIIAIVVIAGLTIGIAVVLRYYSPLTRDWVVRELEKRYNSKVEIGDFQASAFPSPAATASKVVFRLRRGGDRPVFITIDRLSIEASVWGLLEDPRRIRRVRLEGLKIHVPPREDHGGPKSGKGGRGPRPSFVIGEVNADGTSLELMPRDAAKEPKVWQIDRLTLHSAGTDRPMNFVSTLHNAVPPGEIQSRGSFGPWVTDDPGETQVSGDYIFEHADLSVFKGISGILSSKGRYKGTLDNIDVSGETDTPQFMLTTAGHPVHLTTSFHALVDGTNGDTRLEPVVAKFRQSRVVARGGVVGEKGINGKTVTLDVDVTQSRIEDMLALAVNARPAPLSGSISFQAKLVIPPGHREVIRKISILGDFRIGSAIFNSLSIQQKIRELSQRGRGEPAGDPSERVASNMSGHFALNDGTATFSRLSFRVPGALIELHGNYGIPDQTLNFEGTANLQAKLSEMTTGWKSILLKAVDPFFRKGNMTRIPIRIGGTRSSPSFGLALHK